MKEIGLFGITVPEEYGGSPLDAVSFALVFEEISRGVDGHRRHPRQPLALLRDDRPPRHRRAEAALPPRPGDRRAAHRHRPDRARRGHRPAGHPDDRAGATATTTSSPARRPGSPTRVTRTRCRCSSRPTRTPSPRHRGMSILLVDAGTRGLRGHEGHPEARLQGHGVLRGRRSTRSACPSRTSSAASRAAGCSRRSRRSRAGASTSRARSVGIAQRAYDEALSLREGAQGLRPADRGLPGDPAAARRDGDAASRPRG